MATFKSSSIAEKWESLGVLELRTAFSRDQAKKVYVQHLIAKDGPTLFKMLEVIVYDVIMHTPCPLIPSCRQEHMCMFVEML